MLVMVVAECYNQFLNSLCGQFSNMRPKKSHSVSNVLHSMFLSPIFPNEVECVIKSLPSKFSTDVYGISTWLFKQCYAEILDIFTELINYSLTEGIFPDSLKQAKVIPIYKNGDYYEVTNYRPISLLPIFSKVLERVFLNQLNIFLEKENIISDHQFGFRKGKSTLDAINKLYESVVSSLEMHRKTVGVFLDLKKAFDCVDHNLLLDKLYNMGIRGIPFQWVKTYLFGRTQQVQVANQLSTKTKIKFGVPQGSILGPVLFLLYVNNLSEVINPEQIIQYADDTSLIFSSESTEDLEVVSNVDVNKCIQYFQDLNLLTNFIKSNFISFQLNLLASQSQFIQHIVVDKHSLAEVNCTKFLGIYLDKNLDWSSHIEYICNKVSSGVFLLRNISSYCTQKVLKMAYYGLVFPYLTYGISVWGSCAEYKFTRAFILQKKAIRIISKSSSRATCREIFQELEILSLPSLYIYETIVSSLTRCQLKRGTDIHDYNTRHKTLFRQNSHRLKSFENLPSQAGARFLNRLPEEIKSIQSIKLFKAHLKCYLTRCAYYTIGEFMDQ